MERALISVEEVLNIILEVKKGIKYAQKRGELCLLWQQFGQNIAWLRIFKNNMGGNFELAEITSNTLPRKNSDATDSKNSFLIPEIQLPTPSVSLESTIEAIPRFVKGYLPEVANLPIKIYTSLKNYRCDNPAAILFQNDPIKNN